MQQSKSNKRAAEATKREMRAQEVTQNSEVAPATTCTKEKNVNVCNRLQKTIKYSIKSLQKTGSQ